ncbi:MAG: hypothetical protein AAFO98_11885, partial [Pseudomonadota bacterium]
MTNPPNHQRTVRDAVVAGGGYVGLCVAVAIKTASPHLNISLIDGAPEDAIQKEERASAIAAAASRMLDQLGIWQTLLKDAQPIKEMIVTDSRTADPIRPVFLTFGDVNVDAAPNAGASSEPFAHMVPNR